MTTTTTGIDIADVIAPELPFLRRYARALCGTQESGDNFVMATLEAIIADKNLFRRDLSPRVSLYRSFLRVWNALPLNHETAGADDPPMLVADRRIERITPLPRQAFLLSSLEQFSTADVGSILDMPNDMVKQLITAASKEISGQLRARVMVIEDEPLIALDLETLISDIGHDVVGVAATKSEAVALAAKTKPELILSDIQLADGSSGIDAVNEILKNLNVPVVFITAYPERLLTGERAEPTFLITKPFQPTTVKAIVSQALFFDMKARPQ